MKPIYIIDTNVLLYDPQAVYAFPESIVVIPQTVLGELDKLKTSRVDRDLRYRGREVSRILFRLSEKGKLTEGIPIQNNSVIKVASFDPSGEVPESLKTKNSDDRILGLAYQFTQRHSKNHPIILVTNDLNMLLKAQSLGIPVERRGEKEPGRMKALWLSIKAKQSTILWVIIPMLIIMVALTAYGYRIAPYSKPSPTARKVMNEMKAFQIQEYEYLQLLKKNPNDLLALTGLGNLYFNLAVRYGDTVRYQSAIETYQRVLEIEPNNTDVRTDLGVAYLNLGMDDVAMREFQKVMEIDPNHAAANFYIGVFLRTKGDLKGALQRFEKYLDLAPHGDLVEKARENIKELKAELKMLSKGKKASQG